MKSCQTDGLEEEVLWNIFPIHLTSHHFIFFFWAYLKTKCMPRGVRCCIVMLYRIVILSTVFVFFNLAEMMK